MCRQLVLGLLWSATRPVPSPQRRLPAAVLRVSCPPWRSASHRGAPRTGWQRAHVPQPGRLRTRSRGLCLCARPLPIPALQVWGLEKGFCLRTLMCHSSCNSLAITADGSLVASGHFDGTLRFWDMRSGKQAHEVAGLHSQQITSVDAGARWVGRAEFSSAGAPAAE